MDWTLWTEAEKATAVKQWELGLSAGLIAIELSRMSNRLFTRNMVMGKINRLQKDGLIGARNGAIQKKQYGPRVAKPRLVCRPVELPKADPLHVPLEALTKNSCKWTFGIPQDEDFNYCGLPVERVSFCRYHAALVYRKTVRHGLARCA